ncbi:MAG: hypothetical protein VW715_16880, partial [Rhodospirillales bacterium]
VVTPVSDALAYPQQLLKETLGIEDEWVTQDIPYARPSVTGVNMSDPTQPIPEGNARNAANAVLDAVLDPVNVVGSGLFTSGIRNVSKLTGPYSLRGNTLSAPRNWIPNHYKPSGTAVPTAVDDFIIQNKAALSKTPKVGKKIAGLKDAKASANMREKVGSFAKWGLESTGQAIEQTISPSARALYREQGITRTMQETAEEALKSSANRAKDKAVAQVQYTENIGNQTIREGVKSQDVQDVVNRSFLTEPVKATEGSYKRLIKDNKLQGFYENKNLRAPVTDKDLDIIEKHVRTVWKDRRGRSVSETPTADIRIKNPGAGDQITGSHVLDFTQKSKVYSTMNDLYKKTAKPTVEETWSHLKGSSLKLHPMSETLEDARKNGIWVTGSFSGNAITEGGVNFIAKVSPNGRVLAVISDEHNFLEKTPVVGGALEDALPNRSISVTPPMYFDIKKDKKKIKSPQPKDKKDVKQSLQNIRDAKPDPALLRQERRVNTGAGMIGAGMLTGGDRNER